MQAPINWNMGHIFHGGLEGEDFQNGVSALAEELQLLSEQVEALPALEDAPESWAKVLLAFEQFEPQIKDCWTYTHCLSCADTRDKAAAF